MKKLKNKFYILRHGETSYLSDKTHRTYPLKGSLKSVGLTKKGRAQIKEVFLKVKNNEINFIYSSDFLRTKQTSLIFAREAGIPKSRIFFSAKLRDIHLGIYHGTLKTKFYREMGRGRKNFDQKPLKGECLNDVLRRMVDFVEKIDKNHKNENILIVSHGEPLWLLDGYFKKRKKSDLIDENFIKKNYIKPAEIRKLN